MTEFAFQHNIKLASGDLINIRGNDEVEFAQNLDAFVEGLAEKALAASVKVQELSGVVTPNVAAAINTLGGSIVSEAPAAAAPVTLPQGGGEVRTETDKWGNTYVFNLPDAPPTPRGAMVKATKTSRAGKVYSQFVDPAEAPGWYPKPKPADLVAAVWAR